MAWRLFVIIIVWVLTFFATTWVSVRYRFGVVLSTEHLDDPALHEIRKRHIIWSLTSAAVSATAAIVLGLTGTIHFMTASAFAFWIYILFNVGLLIYSRRHTKRLKGRKDQETHAVSDTDNIRFLYILPFIIIIVNVGTVVMYYDRIPEVIPMHSTLSGDVTREEPKSFLTVFALNIVQLITTALLLGTSLLFKFGDKFDFSRAERSDKKKRLDQFHLMMFLIFTNLSLLTLTILQFDSFQFTYFSQGLAYLYFFLILFIYIVASIAGHIRISRN